MEIPIVIPVRNGLFLTRRCIQTLKIQDVPSRIWIYDNDSTDGTSEWARSQDDIVYMHGRNQSVATSWNTCLSRVFSLGYGLCCVFNNDTEFRTDFFRLLLEDGGQFVTGVGVDDPECLKRAPHPESKSPHPHFSAFLIRRECWETVGPFDEAFKGAYAEDSDLHVRMHMAGIQAYSIDVPFYHVGSSTLKNADPDEAQRIRLQADANREYFKQKWGFAVGSPEYCSFFEKPYNP